ncbi:MAG: histidinol-phosphatase HisJ [Defluviitaleaceae bacterium]|nr:histidinol-phosphatase HisJ [Defluviitaleaceae bacterium]
MQKTDGHTHTHYCPHGTGDHVEKMIERALQLGFEAYHITEHTPVPDAFMTLLQPQKELLGDLAMPEQDVDRYIKEMLAIKEKYKHHIQIKVGFEVDYLPTATTWTKDFLQEYGKYCDTGILSVHYMEGLKDWRCIDYQPDDVINGLIPKYGNLENYQKAYYQLVKEAVLVDLGPYKPQTIGHLTLVNKFQKVVGIMDSPAVDQQIDELLRLIKEKNYELDYNHAGLFKPYCGETYPPLRIAQQASALSIPLIYGSDAHGVDDIGRS